MEQLAIENNISLNYLVVQSIEYALEKMDDGNIVVDE
jgi:hypothetical protein